MRLAISSACSARTASSVSRPFKRAVKTRVSTNVLFIILPGSIDYAYPIWQVSIGGRSRRRPRRHMADLLGGCAHNDLRHATSGVSGGGGRRAGHCYLLTQAVDGMVAIVRRVVN